MTHQLYQFDLILAQFEGVNLTLTALKISHLEQLNSKIFVSLSTRFSRLKIDHLIKQIGIKLHIVMLRPIENLTLQ
ncbi:hypothetical protein PPEP_a3864 [Pseudoalteromonas peptidolytica F12-50-A1]|uniref:Uncharacterized protein n=1 Tax=Pseudoalteromonas peptidolytica F12-50-A1 TaxID=1315280 RepID=A0A8I0MWQ5_9GAMM|nr:hypothetical protein [Pseudoalteromonas peptidolytica F12-50-A1]NLR15410.1 hypothetical protein [Pseudoalteromonas peptidolytica]